MTQHHAELPQPFRKILPALSVIAYVFLLIFLCRVIFSPLLPSLQAEMNFTHSQAGRLFFFMAIGGSLGLLTNGFISSILIHRRTMNLSVLLCGLALIATSQCNTYPFLATGLVITGWASGLYLPSGLATITSIADVQNWGKALAVHDMAPNLSFLLAPLLAEGILYFASWREALVVLGSVQVISAIFFFFLGKGGATYGRAPEPGIVRTIAKQPVFWILVVFFGMAIGMGLGLYSMIPLYLINEHGFQREIANQLLAGSRITGLFMTLVSGYLTDRLGVQWTIGLYFAAAGTSAVLLGIAEGALLVFAVFIQPMVATCFFPAGLTALSRAFEETFRSVAVSLVVPLATILGQGLVPSMIGYFGQQGNFYLGFVFMGGILFLGLPILPFLKFLHPVRSAK